MRREWAGRVGLQMQIEDTTLVEGGGSINPRNWAGNLDYIWRDGWIDIEGQWANTTIRYDGDCGCKVSWRGVFMVNEAVDMVGE